MGKEEREGEERRGEERGGEERRGEERGGEEKRGEERRGEEKRGEERRWRRLSRFSRNYFAPYRLVFIFLHISRHKS
ncbi:RNA-binding protein 4F [Liparis tanakae]|uniref:RNA-binding protein 4F n=1 Tax=Liparis tanakae TaxID=230148 RepID=A0A4Z2EHJ3_9TELE|nr:RNA-binding protein 4F [Liparis tanakae]